MEEQPEPHYLPVRRQPQLLRFLLVGGVLGFALGGLVGLLGPDAVNSSLTQEVIVLGLVGMLVVGFLAAIAYLVADQRAHRG